MRRFRSAFCPFREVLRSWWASTREWFSIPGVVPRTPERNAMALCFKAVLAISVLPSAISGNVPPSLAQSPGWMSHGAPWAILIGCIISLAGMALTDRDEGLDLEEVGLVLLGVGLLIYGTAILLSTSSPASARIAVGMCFGIALGTAARWWQLQRYVIAKRREAARSAT